MLELQEVDPNFG